MTWRDESACRDTDPAVFYPPADPHANARKNRTDPYATARTVCDGCPVQADCLTEAIAKHIGGFCDSHLRVKHGFINPVGVILCAFLCFI